MEWLAVVPLVAGTAALWEAIHSRPHSLGLLLAAANFSLAALLLAAGPDIL